MSLTRKYLEGMGLTEEQVSAICEEHQNTLKSIKSENAELKEKVEEFDNLQKENEKLKKNLDELGSNEWEEKFNKEHKAFEDFKKNIEAEKETGKVKEAYKELLKAEGVGEKHIKSILGVTSFDGMKLDKDGNLESIDDLKKGIEDKWSGFKTETRTEGSKAGNPPTGGKTYSSREEIMKISDRSERLKAIQENHELFNQ